jgi:hypothetical protein
MAPFLPNESHPTLGGNRDGNLDSHVPNRRRTTSPLHESEQPNLRLTIPCPVRIDQSPRRQARGASCGSTELAEVQLAIRSPVRVPKLAASATSRETDGLVAFAGEARGPAAHGEKKSGISEADFGGSGGG